MSNFTLPPTQTYLPLCINNHSLTGGGLEVGGNELSKKLRKYNSASELNDIGIIMKRNPSVNSHNNNNIVNSSSSSAFNKRGDEGGGGGSALSRLRRASAGAPPSLLSAPLSVSMAKLARIESSRALHQLSNSPSLAPLNK